MTRKSLLLVLCFILVASILSACGGNNANDNENNKPSSGAETPKVETTNEPVKLTMWGGVPEEAGPKAAVDAWNAANPDIQVEYVRFVNDDAGNLKLDTALVSGMNADLYVNYSKDTLGKRMSGGLALDLSDYEAEYNITDIMGPYAKDWQFDGKYYGLPTNKSMSFIWLNKDALDAAGLDVPALDWTLEDLAEYAKALKTDSRWGYAHFDQMYTFNFEGVMQNKLAVDGKSAFDQPAVRSSLETYHKMMHEDKSIPTYGEQVATKLPVDATFLKGNTAMMGAGSWIFRNASNMTDFPRDFKIAFATVPRPTADTEDYAVYAGLGDVVSINTNSMHKDESWKFLKWYADEGIMYLAPGGRIPSSKNADAEKGVELILQGMEDKYDMESVKNVVFGDYPVFTSTIDSQTKDALKEEYERYFLQELSLDEIITNLIDRHNKLLTK